MTTEKIEKRNREIQLKFRVTPQERVLIDKRMEQVGTVNMAAYLRKMSIDGYVLRLDLPELKEMVSLLRRCSNNLNQIAKRANETGTVYEEDVIDLLAEYNKLHPLVIKVYQNITDRKSVV
jgi:hypothetical protein